MSSKAAKSSAKAVAKAVQSDEDLTQVHVHQLVQDENAKTILLNVPLEATTNIPGENGSFKVPRRPTSSGLPSPREGVVPRDLVSASRLANRRVRDSPGSRGAATKTKTSGQRVRSASVGRDKRSDLQARYWAFLFENLRRAVDDLYHTCEADDSAPAAKEVVLVLENYVKDFKNLVGWFRLKYEYENTPPLQRPTSLAWEVRKTSPGGSRMAASAALVAQQRLLLATPARRALNFDEKQKEPLHTHEEKVEERAAEKPEAKQEVAKAEDLNDKSVDAGSKKEGGSQAEEKENEAPKAAKVAKEAPAEAKPKSSETASTSSQDNSAPASSKPPLTARAKGKKESESVASTSSKQSDVGSKKPLSRAPPGSSGTSNKPTGSCSKASSTQPKSQSGVVVAASVSAKALSRPSSSPGPPSFSKVVSGKTSARGSAPSSSGTSKQSSLSSPDLRRTSTTSAAASKTVDGKAQRVSLVARQSMTASTTSVSSSSSSNARGPLARAATTANISRLPNKSTAAAASTSRSSGGAATRPSTTSTSSKASAAGAKASPAADVSSNIKQQQQNSSLPFGSTSSVSSVGSNRSWADTVKGLKAPRSVENMATGGGATSSVPSGASSTTSTKPEDADEEEGWEAVRSRRRSRVSPVNTSAGMSGRRRVSTSNQSVSSQASRSSTGSLGGSGGSSKAPLRKRESLDSSLKSGHSAKSRFNVPSSAMSLPALAFLEEEAASETGSAESGSKKGAVASRTDSGIKKMAAVRRSAAAGEEAKEKKSHLEKVVETGGDTRSSSESLSEKSSVARKRAGKVAPSKVSAATKSSSARSVAKGPVGGTWVTKSSNNTARAKPSSAPVRVRAAKEKKEVQVEKKKAKEEGKDKKVAPEQTLLRKMDEDEKPTCIEPEAEPTGGDLSDDATDSAIAENEVAIARAEKEREDLAREIRETEKQELSETDGDPSAGEDSDMQSVISDRDSATVGTNTALSGAAAAAAAARATTPLKLEVLLQHESGPLSWADEIDLEEQLMCEASSRYPGRAIQLHEKLSSPARKKEPQEAFKEHQEKQKQARLRREKFQEDKAAKLNALNAKIEEVIAQKDQLMEEQKGLLVEKMEKADNKRRQYIEGIRRKAHMEDAKLKEIAFINELQAQNTRIDMLAHNQTVDEKHEERLAELAEERARKVEERSAKEARAEERRRQMEADRLKSLEALRERIRTREERIQEEQEQARKDREEAAREKARDREEKLSSVRAAEEGLKTELQEKILQKQQEAAKRHKEKLQRIRDKAFELSVLRCSAADGDDSAEGGNNVPHIQAYNPKKKCGICDVVIANEVQLQSHLKGRAHRERISQANEGRKLSGEEMRTCNLRYVVDVSADEPDPTVAPARERHRAMKRRAKKIKARMATRAAEYEKKLQLPTKVDSPNRAKIGKALKDIEKVFGTQGRGAWPNNALASLERSMGEICRAMDKNHEQDRTTFFALGGFNTLARVFHLLLDQKSNCCIPLRNVLTCCRAWSLCCVRHPGNTDYVLKYNHLTTLVDILHDRLHVLLPEQTQQQHDDDGSSVASAGFNPEDCPPPQEGPQTDPLAKSIMVLLAQNMEDLVGVLKGQKEGQGGPEETSARAQDQISYMVAMGTVDKLAIYLQSVQDPIDGKPEVGEFLLACLKFMTALAGVAEALGKSGNNGGDQTQMLQAYKVTDLAGLVSMLYGVLLHQGSPARDSYRDPESSPAPALPAYTAAVALAASQLLLHLVRQDLSMVQEVLAQEGISLEFRHIASYLLWYCCQQLQQKQKQNGRNNHHHSKNEASNASTNKELLHLTIKLVGYFAARHEDNQVILQSGHQPSVLQQLLGLPFPYFSQPDLKCVLFPTLIAACHGNDANARILREDMSDALLDDFKASDDGRENHLVGLVLPQK